MVPVMAGLAEALPVADDSIDAVVVAQAFHWFDAPGALSEIARVLKPGGALGLISNERDETGAVMAELVKISRWDRCMPYPVGMDFAPMVDADGRFGPVTRTKFRFTQEVDRSVFVDQVASRSHVQVLEYREQQKLLAEVSSFAATLGEPIPLIYVTDLFCATLDR
jgi:SAM-dependent methyltransferase